MPYDEDAARERPSARTPDQRTDIDAVPALGQPISLEQFDEPARAEVAAAEVAAAELLAAEIIAAVI